MANSDVSAGDGRGPHEGVYREYSRPPYPATLPAAISSVRNAWPDALALISADRTLTFAALESESAELAMGLLGAGHGKGSRIGLLMPNGPDWVIAFLACARIGAVVVPLSTLYQADELKWAIRHSDIGTLLLTESYRRNDYLSRLEKAFPALPAASRDILLADAPYLRRIFIWGVGRRAWAANAPAALLKFRESLGPLAPALLAAAEASVAASDPLFVVYTSGSTAEPKGVVHGHGSTVRHTYALGHDCWSAFQGDRVATTRPFFWISGLTTLLYGLQLGACHVFVGSDEGVDLLGLIRSAAVTTIFGREPWLKRIVDDPVFIGTEFRLIRVAYDAVGVARLNSSGGLTFVSADLQRAVPAATPPLPRLRFPRTIGMTETLGTDATERSLVALPEDKMGSSGRVVPWMTFRIVDPATGIEAAPGEPGELLVRGASMMSGMYKKEWIETFTADGFYRTGDECVIDDDGYLFFKSRLGEMMKIKGANVSPAEVENALMGLAGVSEATVVDLPTADGDNRLVAAVVSSAGAARDAEGLIRELRSRLSAFKVPQAIYFFGSDDLPRTGSGKVLRKRLKELIATARALPPERLNGPGH